MSSYTDNLQGKIMTQTEIIEIIENTIKKAGGDNVNCLILPTSDANNFILVLYCCGIMQAFYISKSNCLTGTLSQAVSNTLLAYNNCIRINACGDYTNLSNEYKETINKITGAMYHQVKI